MNAPRVLVPPTKALRRLDQFLREINSQRTAADAATEAIDQWIAIQRGHPVRPNIAPARGYQWKTLFLPEGTELRVTSAAGTSAYARVLGDDIIFGNRRTSPRQFCLATLGAGRNAWRDVWVLLPGQLKWRPASLLRRKANRELEVMPATMSPQEAMAAAAACPNRCRRPLPWSTMRPTRRARRPHFPVSPAARARTRPIARLPITDRS